MDSMLSTALREFTGLLEQLLRNLLGRDAQEWGDELKHFLRKEPCWAETKAELSCLRLISGGEEIVIQATAGRQEISQVMDFLSPDYTDPSFLCYEKGVKGQPTPNTLVQVYELIEDGTFRQIFGSLITNKVTLDKLCLSQNQIIWFVSYYASRWFRDGGWGTFFLFKQLDKFFVAHVHRHTGRLWVGVHRLSDDSIKDGEWGYRVVVPKL